MLLPQPFQYPNLSEGADSVGGQLRGGEKCAFSGVINFGRAWRNVKLQALVYDIVPPTTAILDYAIGLEKLSANEQFFSMILKR